MTIIFSPSSSSPLSPSPSSLGKHISSSSHLLNNPLCCCCIGNNQFDYLPHQLGAYQAISAFDKNNNNPNCSLPSEDCGSGPFNNNNNSNGRVSRWKRFLWKLRAQVKKIHICLSPPQQELQYDPLSYAKNFDDGTWVHDAAFFSRFSTPLNPVNQG